MFDDSTSHIEYHPDEAKFQSSLQIKLFGVRLLLTTIFPYLSIPWRNFLNPEIVSQILSVQISACFASAILSLIDMPGFVMKYIFGPLYVITQSELNMIWSGRPWDLAERYTNLSKILFVSLFYAILTPMSLFICAIAFYLTFQVDRYLLLRRWEEPSMLNSDVAKRLRQQMILCVAAHMFITSRFIYSWPMDQAYYDVTRNTYSKVDKYPKTIFLYLGHNEVWQSTSQRKWLVPYQIATGIVCLIVFYYWIINPLFKSFKYFFFKQLHKVGDVMNVPFTSISRAMAYVPTISTDASKGDVFLFADTSAMLPEHKPAIRPEHTLHDDPNMYQESEDDLISSNLHSVAPDLSKHVPEAYRKYVLATVKYYSDDLEAGTATASNSSQDATVDKKEGHQAPLTALEANIQEVLQSIQVDNHQLSARDIRVRDIIGVAAFNERLKVKEQQQNPRSLSSSVSSIPPSKLMHGRDSRSFLPPLHKSYASISPATTSARDSFQDLELPKQILGSTAEIMMKQSRRSRYHDLSASSSSIQLHNRSQSSSRRTSISRGQISDDENRSSLSHTTKHYIPREYHGVYRLDPITQQGVDPSTSTRKQYTPREKSLLRKIRRDLMMLSNPSSASGIRTMMMPGSKLSTNSRVNFAQFYANLLTLCPGLEAQDGDRDSNRQMRKLVRSIFVHAQTLQLGSKGISMDDDPSGRKHVILWKDWLTSIENGSFEQ
jgi:hypothetical protein